MGRIITFEELQKAVEKKDTFFKYKKVLPDSITRAGHRILEHIGKVMERTDNITITQKDLARLLNLSANTISKVLHVFHSLKILCIKIGKNCTEITALDDYLTKKSNQTAVQKNYIEYTDEDKDLAREYTQIKSKTSKIRDLNAYEKTMLRKITYEPDVRKNVIETIDAYHKLQVKNEKKAENKEFEKLKEFKETIDREERKSKIDRFFAVVNFETINILKQKIIAEIKYQPPEKILRGLIYDEALAMGMGVP